MEGFNPFLDGLDLTLKILEGERLGSGQRRDYKREREKSYEAEEYVFISHVRRHIQ